MGAGQAESPAETLLAREGAVLRAYRARLEELQSVLVTNPLVWEECVVQARRILADCAETLRCGRSSVAQAHIPAVVGMAERRGELGIHPTSSTRAAMVLFEVIFAELRDVVGDGPDRAALLGEGALTLHRAICQRLEAGAAGYDAFLLNQVRKVTDADRRELAREIHDRIGNSVSLAMRQLEIYAVTAAGAVGATEPSFPARDTLVDTLGQLRELITELRTSEADGALRSALAAFVNSMKLSRPAVCVQVNGVESWAPAPVLDEIFLVLREALRNTIAHAHAGAVTVTIDVAPHEIWATVEDDGVGTDPGAVTAAGRMHGIASMRERAELLSGILKIGPGTGGGTRVTLWVPITES
jgi:signal transduction histidine kinase